MDVTKRVLLLAVALWSSSTALAFADRAARHSNRASEVIGRSVPARMVQIRPGHWVGSYQCITDLERGGRDCSAGP